MRNDDQNAWPTGRAPLMRAGLYLDNRKKRWKDIRGAGQGIGIVKKVLTVAALAARLRREWRNSRTRIGTASPLVSPAAEMGEGRGAAAWPVRLATCAALLFGSAEIASAQEIEPNEVVPAPDGTSLSLSYFIYGHQSAFTTPSGTNVPNSSANLYAGVERFVHYDYLFGHPAGFTISQAFGSLSDPKVGGTSIGTASGASNLNLQGFFYPYANFEKKHYLAVAVYLYPPTGTYDKNKLANFATFYQLNGQYNWTGDVQTGWNQGIGEHFSYDLLFDARISGDTTGPISPGSGIPISVTTHHNNDYRVQLWLNWSWNPALTTAIGYQGFFGGLDSFNNPLTGNNVDTGKSFQQRLRGAVTMFFSPRIQGVLEVNGDVARQGGYK